jgi:hypothetical protein
MKKFLLSISFMTAVFVSNGQTVFNEFYTDPNSGKEEFFELYNTSPNQTPENLNCYTIITWYKIGNATGFYVLDLPNLSVDSKKWFVGAASDPFDVQAQTNVDAAFSWNNFADASGSLRDYRRNGNSYDVSNVPANFNDFFHTNTGTEAAYAMFMFKDGQYINGFIGGHNSASVPTDITSMPLMNVDMDDACSDFQINWSNILFAENTTANGGTDNGFIRDRDGKCGSWKKSSSQVQHTPGASNGAATGLTGSITTTESNITCYITPGKSRITYSVTGVTGDATVDADFPVTVQFYRDLGTLGQLDGADVIIKDTVIDSPSNTQYFFDFNQTYNLIIVYSTNRGCFDKVVSRANPCQNLPVNFKSFTATRTNRTNVAVRWETATEQNSAGFAVERNIKGNWEIVTYIPSQAQGGNSTSVLTYQMNDLNSAKGISQYRIRQVDLDAVEKLSEIRSVRGEGQKGSTIVYPNPSSDGKANVVFQGEFAKRDVTVQDMSGRIIKQWRNYTNNNIQIDNLTPGFYTIRIVNIETGEQNVEKLVVNNR